MKRRRILQITSGFVVILVLSGFFVLFIPQADAQEPEDVGTYEYSMYIPDISGPFVGECTRHITETEENITTSYGSYIIDTISSQSDLRLEHEDRGYYIIEDSASYHDSNSFLRYSEQTFVLRVSGYVETSYTASYEYGSYMVIVNNETDYAEMYLQRYYENGMLQEETYCADWTKLHDHVNITIDLGTFECYVFKTTFYEGTSDPGYGYAWVDTEGRVIKQEQYDEYDELLASIVLVAHPDIQLNPGFPGLNLSVVDTIMIISFAAVGVGVLMVILIIARRPRTPKPSKYGEVPIPI
jgi:hypothetical protein